MTSKTVEFYEEARLESAAAFEWYLERSDMAASRFVAELNRAIALIAEAPQRWPTGSWNQEIPAPAISFLSGLSRIPSKIQVVAVAHGHRRPGYWKNRL